MPSTRREYKGKCSQTGQKVRVIVTIPDQGNPTYTCDNVVCPINGDPHCPIYWSYTSTVPRKS